MCYQSLCVASVNGCDIDTATDLGAAATVTFANGNFSYAPKCIKVNAGAVVTFNGNFVNHPHQGGQVLAGLEIPDATGPFATLTNTGNTMAFTMDTAGTFPYYCVPHGASQNMTGAVFVSP
jgi:plastocyanin